jgi:hypothetical protein
MKEDIMGAIKTVGKSGQISNLTWQQVYEDRGLKWEAISSRSGPHGARLYTFRIGRGFRCVAFREKGWMRMLSLHPDHVSAFGR